MTHTSTEQPEALPCPFCGGHSTLDSNGQDFRVFCWDCGAKSKEFDCWQKAEAAWNRRAPAVPVPQEPTSKQVVLGAGALLGQPENTADNRHPDWHSAVAKARSVYLAMLAAALQPPEADHIPDAGKMDTNVRNWMNAALSKDVACPACGLSGLHACPSASTAESQGADAVKALEKVLRAVQRHLPPERIGERETIAEIISIVDPWPLGKPPEPWKDHMTAELVGKLTDVARQFHGTQQLRERIAGLVRPVCERIKQFDGDRMPEVDMGNPISAAAPVQLPEPPFWYCESKTPDAIWPIGRTTKKRESAFKDGYFNQQALYTEQQVRQLLADQQFKLDELAMLTRMVVHALRQVAPDNKTAAKAVDYLKRKGLQGNPLRH